MKGTWWREREQVAQAGWPGSAGAGGCQLAVSPGSKAVSFPSLLGGLVQGQEGQSPPFLTPGTRQAACFHSDPNCANEPGEHEQGTGPLCASVPLFNVGMINPASV